MSNNYVPCLNRIDFVVIPSYVELPWILLVTKFKKLRNELHSLNLASNFP